MDSSSLSCYLELVAGSGHVFTVEQRAAMQMSLVTLKKNHKFHRVLFWGKILGLDRDYFIAQGRQENEMGEKKNLYSLNCIDWLLLPAVTDSMIEDVSKAPKCRFTGDPSIVPGYKKPTAEESEENMAKAIAEKPQIGATEEKMLAVTIHYIDEEVSVVPRGAFIKTPNGTVQLNRSFTGLSESESQRMENFVHFREPMTSRKRPLEAIGDWSPAVDFLDPLDGDIPTGSWSLQFEGALKVCVLRSLLWVGLTFYHVPMTPQHGYIYIGDGIKNLDLPFTL